MPPSLPSQLVSEPASYLCSSPWAPARMTGFLVKQLQQHFSHAANLGISPLRNYEWHSAAPRGNILIESLTRWDPTAAGRRPAILIRRNDWQVSQAGIGNRLQGDQHIDGRIDYSVMMQGSHSLFCLSVEAAECEELAFEVFQQIVEFHQELRRELNLLRLLVSSIGRPLPVLESREHFGIPIDLGYCHTHSWSTRQQAPRVGSISVDTPT